MVFGHGAASLMASTSKNTVPFIFNVVVLPCYDAYSEMHASRWMVTLHANPDLCSLLDWELVMGHIYNVTFSALALFLSSI
jgi:hypothetical protein